MIEATNLEGLDRLKTNLASQPSTLDELWFSQPGLWRGLGWEKAQLKLWLGCQPDIEVAGADTETARYEHKEGAGQGMPDLGEEVAKILQSVSKPMPIALLKNKLPSGFLATEPMIKAAINKHPGLALTGPLVKLK